MEPEPYMHLLLVVYDLELIAPPISGTTCHQKRTKRTRRATLAPYHFAQIGFRDLQLEERIAALRHLGQVDGVGLIDDEPNDSSELLA